MLGSYQLKFQGPAPYSPVNEVFARLFAAIIEVIIFSMTLLVSHVVVEEI